MSWAPTLQWLCISLAALCALVSFRWTRKRRNRQINLPPPRCDERDSIQNFKRMHQP